MITKEQALNNLGRAYFADKVEWKIFMNSGVDLDQRMRYGRANEKYETLRTAYLECNVIQWDDIDNAWWYGIKLERPIE